MAGVQRGPRGERVTLVAWTEEDGTQGFRAYAAAGIRPTKHASAADFKAELLAAGIEEHTITVMPLEVR